jgi:hypothetical protein
MAVQDELVLVSAIQQAESVESISHQPGLACPALCNARTGHPDGANLSRCVRGEKRISTLLAPGAGRRNRPRRPVGCADTVITLHCS